jgi:hypothetical protein
VHPLEIDAVECSPLGREKVVVRLTGRWSGRRRSADGRALLVVEAGGRRHRFPAIPEPRRARIGRPGTWAASFALPSWLEPSLDEQMSLWLGDVSIPLPPVTHIEGDSPDGRAQPSQPEDARAEPNGPPPEHDSTSPGPGDDQLPSAPRPPNGDPPVELVARIEQLQAGLDEAHREADRLRGLLAQRQRSGEAIPAADQALHETISALRTELQERAASEAHVRGVLARTQAELESRLASQTRLESVQAELRVELDQLSELLQRESARREEVESKAVVMAAQLADLQEQLQELTAQLGQLRGELAETVVMRDAARGEAAALRTELDRLGAELAIAQQDTATRDAGLDEAEALLAEARSLTARFTARRSSQDADAGIE